MSSAQLNATYPTARAYACRDTSLLVALTLLVGLPWLGQEIDWDSREVRHALIPAEMAERHDYLMPTLLGEPYIYKPPVGHILTAWIYHACGGPNMFLGRLVSVLSGLVCVLACYGFARLLYERKSALIASVMLIGIPGFGNILRKSRPDMLFAAAIMVSCGLVLWGMSRKETLYRLLLFFCAGVAFGLANLAKGPYGIFYAIFPVAVVVCAPWQRQDLLRPKLWEWPAVLLGCCVFPAAWIGPLYARPASAGLPSGKDFIQATLSQHDPSGEHRRHPFWYFGRIPLLLLPWSCFIPALVKAVQRTPSAGGRAWRLTSWASLCVALVTLAALSAVGGKRDHYLAPWYPFAVLPLGVLVARYWEYAKLGKLVRVLLVLSLLSVPVYYGLLQPYVMLRNNPEREFCEHVVEALPERAAVVTYRVLHEELAWVARCRRWQRSPVTMPAVKPEEVLSGIERAVRSGLPTYLVVREKDFAASTALLAHVRLRKIIEYVSLETGLDKALRMKDDEGTTYLLYEVVPEEPALNIASLG